jgi:phospholipid transport system transporter-binding protein
MEVRLPAVLTHAQANTCAKALQAALRMGQSGPAVVVNASALRQFDSSALAVLLDCRRFAVSLGLSFSVAGMPPRLRQLAGLYGLAELVPAASEAAPVSAPESAPAAP